MDHVIPVECGGADVPSNMQYRRSRKQGLKVERKETAGGNDFFGREKTMAPE